MSAGSSFIRDHGPVTSEALVRMATLMNDFNPVHYDLEFARSIGLPNVVGPATLLQAWILADTFSLPLDTRGSAEVHGIRGLDLRLHAPFFVGDVLRLSYSPEGQALRVKATTHSVDEPPRQVATALIQTAPRGTNPR